MGKMPPKRGRRKKTEDDTDEAYEQRTSESDQEPQGEVYDAAQGAQMEQGYDNEDIQLPDDESSNSSLKRQYYAEQDAFQPDTKKTKVDDVAEDYGIPEEQMSEEQKLIMMEQRMKREK